MSHRTRLLMFAILTGLAASPSLVSAQPLVIGHRGASGYRPEHTLASYSLAIDLGADYIEPDLVSTKDGVLIARHEPMLGSTTDVAARSGIRGLQVDQDARRRAGDRLVRQRLHARRDQDAARHPAARRPRSAVQRPLPDSHLRRSPGPRERPAASASIRRPSTPRSTTASACRSKSRCSTPCPPLGGTTPAAPVFIQSFEVSNLQELNQLTDVKLVQLIDADDVKPDGSMSLVAPYAQPYDFVVSGDPRTFADLLTPAGLDFVNDYADGIGPWKPYLLRTRIFDPNHDGIADDRNLDGVVNISDREVVGDTGVIAAAHAAGLVVHGFTFRNDASLYGFSDPIAEYKAYYAIGIDGVFSDFPDTALQAQAFERLMANVADLSIGGRGAEGIRRSLVIMSHSVFIAGAYAVTLLIVAGLIVRAIVDFRFQKRALTELESRGAGRRSVRNPVSTS